MSRWCQFTNCSDERVRTHEPPIETVPARHRDDGITGAAIYPKEQLLEFAQAHSATGYALDLIPAKATGELEPQSLPMWKQTG